MENKRLVKTEKITIKDHDGNIREGLRTYEYDERGNCIHEKDSTGFETWREYDEYNNCIRYKTSDGFEQTSEFTYY